MALSVKNSKKYRNKGTKKMAEIFVALDFKTEKQVFDLVEQLDSSKCKLKIGKELFTSQGTQIVQKLIAKGFDIFLDLKFHDIPNTCANAVLAAADLGVYMVNVHTLGGTKMMSAAKELLEKHQMQTKLIGVTILTSHSQEDLQEIGINQPIEKMVLHLANLAKKSGLDGVVCSAQEAENLRTNLGNEFLKVTPGIRLATDAKDDQTRIVTPDFAVTNGSTHLVVGRPITKSPEPAKKLAEILQLMQKA